MKIKYSTPVQEGYVNINRKLKIIEVYVQYSHSQYYSKYKQFATAQILQKNTIEENKQVFYKI